MEYHNAADEMRDKLNAVSPSLCLAKWQQVSINLPAGLTQSCYHPPTHVIPLEELKASASALHNTKFKMQERKQMLEGLRPEGCSYCWRVEDAASEDLKGHLSDRHYRSSEWWAAPTFDEVVKNGWDYDVKPKYVEVNFNQACNFKCMYCSPHLSTTWEDEIEKFGPYQLEHGGHNDIEALRQRGLMPIRVASKDNPYVEAFWKWWPEIYRGLRVFRMTGGEPLMDKNTFKVLDYIDEHPHGQLELSITSNLCPPDQKLFEKFITKIKKLEEIRLWWDRENINPHTNNYRYIAQAYKHFMLFVSLDGYGAQAEYMRTGMNFEQLKSNVKTFLQETKFTSITFINTFNILSIPSLKQFLDFILELRSEFGARAQEEIVIQPPYEEGYGEHPPHSIKKTQRVWFDIPMLRYPHWFTIQNSGSYGEKVVKDCIEYMRTKPYNNETFEGFNEFEILKLTRDLAILKEILPHKQLELNKNNFYQFITEFDRRRNTNFLQTFPELTEFWQDCARAYSRY